MALSFRHDDKLNAPLRTGGAPMFKIDLRHVSPEPFALSFPEPPVGASPRGSRKRETSRSKLFPLSRDNFCILIQGLVISIQFLTVFGLLYWSHRVTSNVMYYSNMAAPYVDQAVNHGLSIIKHADNASASMEHMAAGADTMSATAIPEMLEAVNRSASMVSHMQQLALHPTIRMTLGSD